MRSRLLWVANGNDRSLASRTRRAVVDGVIAESSLFNEARTLFQIYG